MEDRINKKNVIMISGAFVAWVLGSGFATGQEILQFFSSYGYMSFAIIGICLAGFIWAGGAIMSTGFTHCEDNEFSQTKHFCGKKLGSFYDVFIPVSMFAGMILVMAGAGATMEEFYGINHCLGTVIMGILAFLAFIGGFQRFVKAVSFIGPVIIAFTVIVAAITVIRDFDSLSQAGEAAESLERLQPTGFFWLSGLLYIAYNVTGASMYYTKLGGSAFNKKEAVLGAMFGGIALMLAVGLMNTAMLTDTANCGSLSIPTLYLAKKISVVLSILFSVVLLCGMFSTSSAMLWTVATAIGGEDKKKATIAAGIACKGAMLIGLLPFTQLISIIYPYVGYINLAYIACVLIKSSIGRTERKRNPIASHILLHKADNIK